MARTDNLTNYLTDVADAIREKKGTTDVIPANTFDEEIKNLPSGSGDVSEYFETTVTNSNKSYFYSKMLKKIPEITIHDDVTNLDDFFWFYEGSVTPVIKNTSHITSMKSIFYHCENMEKPPVIDTSNVTNLSSAFNNCRKMLTAPVMNTAKVTDMYEIFASCTNLVTIPQYDASSLQQINSFCSWAKNVENFGGLVNLGKAYLTTQSANYNPYGLNLSFCTKLTHDSLMNAINNLYDIASIGVQPQKLVLGSDNLAKITDEEKAIAQNKGWSLS